MWDWADGPMSDFMPTTAAPSPAEAPVSAAAEAPVATNATNATTVTARVGGAPAPVAPVPAAPAPGTPTTTTARTPSVPDGGLARTGADVVLILLFALTAVLIGVLLVRTGADRTRPSRTS